MIGISLYQGYTTRTRIMEGISLAMAVKAKISTDVNNDISLQDTITQWNAGSGGKGITSKYVESILLKTNGEIEIKYKSDALGLGSTENTLIVSPWIKMDNTQFIPLQQAIQNGITGALDWSCASASKKWATSNGMTPTSGTLPSGYAPDNCR